MHSISRAAGLAASSLVLTILLVPLTGCERQPAPPASGGTAAAQPAADTGAPPSPEELARLRGLVQGPPAAAPGAGGLPAGHPPIGGAHDHAHDQAPAGPPPLLRFEAPAEWREEPVASSMRAAQFRLPGAAGDAELVVFVFGTGQGGDVASNVERWRSQFTTAEGQPIPDGAFISTQERVNALDVTIVDVAGRYQPTGMAFGGPPPAPLDDQRMLGALVQLPGGLWVFRAVGPAGTMNAYADDFRAFVRTFRAEAYP